MRLAALLTALVLINAPPASVAQDAPDPELIALLRKAASEQFERSRLLGEVDRREAANPVTFANAVDLLVRRRILERVSPADPNEPAREGEFVRGEAFDDLAALRDRLAASLAAG